MSKPHEETWVAHKDTVVLSAGWRTVFLPHEDTDGDGTGRARALLAAQAPAMARLLLDVIENMPYDDTFEDDYRRIMAGAEATLRAAGVLGSPTT